MVNILHKTRKILSIGLFFLISGLFLFLPKTSFANDVFRVTEYKVTSFSGTTYNLNLNNDLASNHFILIRGSEAGNVIKSANNSYVRISKLPSGANKNLPTTGTPRLMELKRYAAGSSNWTGVVTVVECLADCDTNGFKTLDILDMTTPSYTSTANRVQTGTSSSGTNWTDVSRVVLFGGAFGAGSNIESSTANSGYYNSGWMRLYPSGTNTINWQRYNGNNDNILSQASHNVYVVQWGSAWSVQRVNVSGSSGSNGANSTNSYNTGTITSVVRANTWVWGTGYSQAASVGNGAEGTLITLGNGVAKNASETRVAVGQENSTTRSFDVYVMTHPNLAVNYVFKTDGSGGTQNVNVTTTSATDTLSRMGWVTTGMSDITNIYPAPLVTARYTSATNIALEREYYTAAASAYTAWTQGIYFKSIQYTPMPTLNQDHYRFRDDTKTLNESNGWISNLDTNPNLFSKNTNYRVRFAVSNSGETDSTSGKSFKLQYGFKSTNNCSDITSWFDLTSATNIATFDSTMYTNQNTTSMLFSGYNNYNFISGYGVDSTNLTNVLALPNNRFTELEYAFKISNSITDGKYCFRLFNSTSNAVFSSYGQYPEVNVGNYLAQDYYKWYQNSNSVNPLTALSNENSECFVSISDQARLRLNIQSQFVSLNSSSKQFKVQYSKSSSAGPWSDVSAISSVSNWWNNSYSNRRKINFGTTHSLLQAGYTSSFTMDTRVGLSSGDDIRIVFQKTNGENIEIDRIADVWNAATSKIEFKLKSNISANTNEASDGSYYVYYGNTNAVNPPSDKVNVYYIYDDFNDSKIRSDWNYIDNDKAQNTNFSESNGSLNINSGGIDTWESSASYKYDDYSAIYQNDVSGDFDVVIKQLYQDNMGNSENVGLMLKNDITKTQASNGYFTAMTTMGTQFISSWDNSNNGYLDTMSYLGTVTWPSCLRIVKSGTILNSYYSNDCITFTKITTQTISSVSSAQDIGVYVLSSTDKLLSLGKFDYFKLSKYVATAPTITLSTADTKYDWEFYDNAGVASSQNITQSLLSNSNVGELYSELNPTSLNPNTINADQRGEWDFSLTAKNTSKGAYYFRVVKSDGSILDEYKNYPKISVGNYLTLNSYRWYQNSNSINPTTALSNENTEVTINSLDTPIRLRLNIGNLYKNFATGSDGLVLQYSKTLNGGWYNVAQNADWEFYDNASIASNSYLSSNLLSSSTTTELYSEQNPTLQNVNPINNTQFGEYDFSLLPKNASEGKYYFRLIKSSNLSDLDNYLNYPQITINTKPTIAQSAYKIFGNIDSINTTKQLSAQNSAGNVKSGSEFRLKLLLSVSGNGLSANKYFKLQYAEKGTGSCSSPQYAYSIIKSTSPIIFTDNASLDDNQNLVGSDIDLTQSGINILKQSYKEYGDFSNNISALSIGDGGQWDFALKENNAGVGKTYCFRAVNEDESVISSYAVYPEVSITAGFLSVDMVDTNGNSIASPTFSFSPIPLSFSVQTSTSTLGEDSKKIRITNTTNNKLWTVSIAPTNGPLSKWTSANGIDKYDFNNANTNLGAMKINPSVGSITPEIGHSSSGLSLGSEYIFKNGIVDSITIASSSSTSENDAYWDLKNIALFQTIPSHQASGNYSIDMTITIIGN